MNFHKIPVIHSYFAHTKLNCSSYLTIFLEDMGSVFKAQKLIFEIRKFNFLLYLEYLSENSKKATGSKLLGPIVCILMVKVIINVAASKLARFRACRLSIWQTFWSENGFWLITLFL